MAVGKQLSKTHAALCIKYTVKKDTFCQLFLAASYFKHHTTLLSGSGLVHKGFVLWARNLHF